MKWFYNANLSHHTQPALLLHFDRLAIHKACSPIFIQPCDEAIQQSCCIWRHICSLSEKLSTVVFHGGVPRSSQQRGGRLRSRWARACVCKVSKETKCDSHQTIANWKCRYLSYLCFSKTITQIWQPQVNSISKTAWNWLRWNESHSLKLSFWPKGLDILKRLKVVPSERLALDPEICIALENIQL